MLAHRVEDLRDLLEIASLQRLIQRFALTHFKEQRYKNVAARLTLARPPHRAADSLDDVNLAAARIHESDHVHRWHINAFGQAPGIRYDASICSLEFAHSFLALHGGLRPGNVKAIKLRQTEANAFGPVRREGSRSSYAGVKGDDAF